MVVVRGFKENRAGAYNVCFFGDVVHACIQYLSRYFPVSTIYVDVKFDIASNDEEADVRAKAAATCDIGFCFPVEICWKKRVQRHYANNKKNGSYEDDNGAFF